MKLIAQKVAPFFLLAATAVAVFLAPLTFNGDLLAVAQAQEKGLQEASCVQWSGINPAACAAWAANGMLTVAGYFTWMGGVSLNHAVDITILQMGTIVNSTEAIESAWTVLRDIANIGLIFALLAIGIATILQVSGYGMRELLAKLIIVALLLNFSFFITKAIIDVGNGISVVAYQQLCGQTGGCSGGGSQLSDRFMQALKLPTIYDTNGAYNSAAAKNVASGAQANTMDWGKILLAGVFGSIFLIVAGFVFLAGAILLVLRFVILVLLMILSPVAWMASILPKTRGAAAQWWETLWKEVFFAPAYLILLLATLWIVQDNALAQSVNLGNAGFSSAILAGDTSSAILFIYYAIIIGFMVASLLIARKIGAYGSGTMTGLGQKWAKNIGSYARRGAGAATFGAAGFVGRNTVGRVANSWANSNLLKSSAAQGGISGAANRVLLKTARGLEKSSFDMRTAPLVGDALSKQLGLGTPSKAAQGGYKKVRETVEKNERQYAKSLGDKNALTYADQVLNKRTILSTITGTTAARRAVAKKFIEADKESTESKELKTKKRGLKAEVEAAKARLVAATTDTERNMMKNRLLELDRQVEEVEDKLNDLKSKADKQKEDDKKDGETKKDEK